MNNNLVLIAKSILASTTIFICACTTPQPRPDACAQPLSAAITNSCVVADGVLWRGGKPSAEGAAALAGLGVRSVVNLEWLHSDLAAFAAVRSAPGAEIEYFRVPEWEPNVVLAPDRLDEHVAQFLAIVRTQPRPVYVHCRAGQNRTGVMVGAYRIIEQQMPVEQAIEEMGRYQGFWFEQDAAYLRQLQPGSARRHRIETLAAQHDANPPPAEALLRCSAQGCLAE